MKAQPNSNDRKSKRKFTHLDLEKRRKLLELVKSGYDQKSIAEILNVSITTVSRELCRNRTKTKNKRKKQHNICSISHDCKITHLCKNTDCRTLCKNCFYWKRCNEFCPYFQTNECKRLTRFPYICDGCKNLRYCFLDWYRYYPEEADKKATLVLHETRRGIDMTEEDFSKLDEMITSGTKKGQSIEHIAMSHNLPVTSRTIRNYIDAGIMTTKKTDTPRGASYKPRSKKISKEQQSVIRRAKEGRDYASFLRFATETGFLFYMQMDTVDGPKREGDTASLLTFISPNTRLFLCFPLKNKKHEKTKTAIDSIFKILGCSDFKFLFNLILTDNGIECPNPIDIEVDSMTGEVRSHVFYCHPYSSWEKGAIENCHSLLRRIIPKGTSLKNITKADTHLINSHINSYFRESNGEQSAYMTFCNAFGERGKRILQKLHVSLIKPDDILLHPSLIRHEK